MIRGRRDRPSCLSFLSMASRSLLIRTLKVFPRRSDLSPEAYFPFLKSRHEHSLAQSSPCETSDSCPDPHGCIYHSTLGRFTPEDPYLVHRHQKPSPPFAWQFVTPDDDFSITLHLFGSAALSLEEHRQVIERITSPADERTRLFTAAPSSDAIFSLDDIVSMNHGMVGLLRVEFLSPLRVMDRGTPSKLFSPSRFLMNLVRRLTSLAAWYGEDPMEADFTEIARRAAEVRVVASRIRWEERSPRIRGLVGWVDLEGIADDLLPYILFGTYGNAGNNASWGFGQYRLSPVSR